MSFARIALAAGIACIGAFGSATAADYTVGDITIIDPWARATAGAGAGAAFLTIDNAGSKPDRLVGASSNISKTAALHTHIREGDVMRMRRVGAIEVPAKARTTLQPGGLHIMFMDLAEPLSAGSSFPLTLRFAEAGEVSVTVDIKDLAAMGHDAATGHDSMGGHGKPAGSGY